MFYSLLDRTGRIIMTNRSDQKVMTPFIRGTGTLDRLEGGGSRWVPSVPANTPFFERWKRSFYVEETSIGGLSGWRLVLEQPVEPFQKILFGNYTDKLTFLFLVLLLSLALAEVLSRRIVAPLRRLGLLTEELPARLAVEDSDISWPESGMQETHDLISNFKDMADSLSGQFHEARQANEMLEQRVEERTKELELANESLRDINELFALVMKHSPIYVFIKEVTASESRVLQVSDNFQQMLGIPAAEMVGKSMAELFPAEFAAKITADDFNI